MNKYIIILLIVFSNLTHAQQKLDTIYANDQKNVALFFPNPIRQGITGVDHFVFTYNLEKEQYFGLLQARPGTESNLLTITNNGQVYAYILKYADTLPKLNYFIEQTQSIGNEKPLVIKLKSNLQPINEQVSRIPHFRKFSEYLLNSKPNHIKTKRKKRMKFRLQEMVYNVSEVYLVLEIENKSGIDFEVDYLNIYRTNGNKKRKASYQRLKQEVVYTYNSPSIIRNKHIKRFVWVLPKFVLGDNEKLQIELKELNGSRNIALKAKK